MVAAPEIVTGMAEAAKVAGISIERLGDEMDHFRLPFFEVDGEYIFARASLERLAA